MSPEENTETTEQLLLNVPLVGQLELASLTLPAEEWLKLRVGDVVSTTLPAGSPIVLRVGGRVLASGKLVLVDGEVGMQIERLVRPAPGAAESG